MFVSEKDIFTAFRIAERREGDACEHFILLQRSNGHEIPYSEHKLEERVHNLKRYPRTVSEVSRSALEKLHHVNYPLLYQKLDIILSGFSEEAKIAILWLAKSNLKQRQSTQGGEYARQNPEAYLVHNVKSIAANLALVDAIVKAYRDLFYND